MSVATTNDKRGFIRNLVEYEWITKLWQELTFTRSPAPKERNLLFKIEAAASRGQLAVGIAEVWKAADKKNARLLVAERNYIFPEANKVSRKQVLPNIWPNEVTSLTEAVDNTVKKVLEHGGDVEFVENGALKRYKRMVMIHDE